MSVTKTLNTAVSGLRAQQEALGIVGDNIANTNTVGFKQSRALFEDILGNFSGQRSQGAGAGARMVRAQQIFSQGALRNTDVPNDLALSGDGFFVYKGAVDGLEGNFYSRDGSFIINANGTLVSSAGLKLQGFTTPVGDKFGGTLGDIQLQTLTLPPKETSVVTIDANLDANAAAFGKSGGANSFDPLNPAKTSDFSTSLTIFDSQGNPHGLDAYFVRTNDGTPAPGPNVTNNWEVHVLNGNTEVATPVGGPPAGPPMVSFDAAGRLSSADPITVKIPTWDAGNPNAAHNSLISFKVGEPLSAGGTGLAGLTQYGQRSAVSAQSQDGYAPADLTSVEVAPDGTVNGVYSNSQKFAIAQVAIARFASNDGLARAGHNLYSQTTDSGQVSVGAASSGGRGAIVAGAVEQSNVDIGAQFVDMITYQRAFSANAKTISTADELLVETVNLKR